MKITFVSIDETAPTREITSIESAVEYISAWGVPPKMTFDFLGDEVFSMYSYQKFIDYLIITDKSRASCFIPQGFFVDFLRDPRYASQVVNAFKSLTHYLENRRERSTWSNDWQWPFLPTDWILRTSEQILALDLQPQP